MPLAALTTYTALKTVHVLAVAVWLGGAVMLTILAIRAQRTEDPHRLVQVVRDVDAIAGKLFPPMALVLLATGFGMIADGDLDFELWVVLALIGWALTFITGMGVLTPQTKKVNRLLEQEGPESPVAQAQIRRLLMLARIDLVVLALVVADMVVKPT